MNEAMIDDGLQRTVGHNTQEEQNLRLNRNVRETSGAKFQRTAIILVSLNINDLWRYYFRFLATNI